MRETVKKLFEEGKTDIIPLQIEAGDPLTENIYSDIITVSGRISRFEYFYRDGGPFKRALKRSEWAEKININSYQWPSESELLPDFDKKISEFMDLLAETGKFRMLKILGPTETAEAFCTVKTPNHHYSKDRLSHNFDYSYLCWANFQAAEEIHNRLTEYILYLLENSNMIRLFDSVRIADDVFDYHGYLYPPEFISKVWRLNHKKISSTIKNLGVTAVLHTDGDPSREIDFIESNYNGLHPLDMISKNNYSELLDWLNLIEKLISGRRIVVFTGLPINFLYGSEEQFTVLKKFIVEDLPRLRTIRFILSTTHRPYSTVNIRSEIIKNRYNEIKKIRDIILGFTH
ncbi:MAG: hypothetical protein QW327_00895 [Candidatus Odinarchaeota archaeon]